MGRTVPSEEIQATDDLSCGIQNVVREKIQDVKWNEMGTAWRPLTFIPLHLQYIWNWQTGHRMWQPNAWKLWALTPSSTGKRSMSWVNSVLRQFLTNGPSSLFPTAATGLAICLSFPLCRSLPNSFQSWL